MEVAIVTVGDELLTGRTTNRNATWLCDRLDERGVSVARVTTVPDAVEDIAPVVNVYRAAYDAVIVTGGIGPTHDDVTMEGVAAAFGRSLETDEAVLEWLEAERGYAREDLTPGTAELPRGARPLHNPVGVAPGCVLLDVYVLPGVPEEMEGMFETIADEFHGRDRYRAVVRTGEPESALVDRLRTVRDEFGVTVGSYPGRDVELVLTATDEATLEAATDWLQTRVDPPANDERP